MVCTDLLENTFLEFLFCRKWEYQIISGRKGMGPGRGRRCLFSAILKEKKCTFFQYEIITNETEENYLYELFICTTNYISQSSCLFMILQYYIFTGFGISWRRGDISLNITTSSYAKLPLWIYIKIDTLDRQIAKMKGEKKKRKSILSFILSEYFRSQAGCYLKKHIACPL